MKEITDKKKTATITFRFDTEIIDKLQKEAKNHQVTTNTLATQALKRFLEWDIYQQRVGLVSLNKPVFVKDLSKFEGKRDNRNCKYHGQGRDERCGTLYER